MKFTDSQRKDLVEAWVRDHDAEKSERKPGEVGNLVLHMYREVYMPEGPGMGGDEGYIGLQIGGIVVAAKLMHWCTRELVGTERATHEKAAAHCMEALEEFFEAEDVRHDQHACKRS